MNFFAKILDARVFKICSKVSFTLRSNLIVLSFWYTFD